jgi:hypothetical protein
MPHFRIHDDHRIALIVRLRDEGFSMLQIGRRLRMTRNAIAGVFNRFYRNNPDAVRRPPPAPVVRARPQVMRDFRGRRGKRNSLEKPAKKPASPSVTPRLAGFEPRRVNFFDLRLRDCRYPLDDGTYCGCPSKMGKSFCEHHAEICYQR